MKLHQTKEYLTLIHMLEWYVLEQGNILFHVLTLHILLQTPTLPSPSKITLPSTGLLNSLAYPPN